jgi:hypothetical protein
VLTEEWWIVADAAFLAVVWPSSAATALALPSWQSRGGACEPNQLRRFPCAYSFGS